MPKFPQVQKAAEILRAAKYPLFLSGAGISAESGIPTFRSSNSSGADSQALWSNYRAEDLATAEAFARDPMLVWSWYNWRKSLIREKKPNAAHWASAELAKKIPALLTVTQNVDGFHGAAGLPEILEMHGNIFSARCMRCAHCEAQTADVYPHTRCPACSETALRPGVVWFGEQLPGATMRKIYERLAVCDAMLVVGTSGTVYPAAAFAIEVRRREGTIIEINTDTGHKPYANDIYICGKAAEVLPELAAML